MTHEAERAAAERRRALSRCRARCAAVPRPLCRVAVPLSRGRVGVWLVRGRLYEHHPPGLEDGGDAPGIINRRVELEGEDDPAHEGEEDCEEIEGDPQRRR
jgi:hypothetical protein